MKTQAVNGLNKFMEKQFPSVHNHVSCSAIIMEKQEAQNTEESIIIMPNNQKLFRKPNLEERNNTLCATEN
jgi:hypothetical protein